MERQVRITHTARWVPKNCVTNHDLAKIMDTSDEWISSRTGIKQRHIVASENTSDLCIEVAKQLLAKSQLDPAELDFIIVATMTPDFATPSTACLVQGAIGAKNAFAFDMSAACSGFVYALATAEKFLRSGSYQKGIVIGGETLSKVVDWTDRRTAVLFGDGAGGVLLQNTTGNKQFLAESLHANGEKASALTAVYKGSTQPFFAATQQDFSEYLAMDGREIFDFALRQVSQDILAVLAKAQLTKEELAYILPHQANTRIFDGMAKKSKIERSKFLSNIAEYGNTSAASIPILLDEMIEKGTLQLGSGQKVILTGFGGGLTWASLVLAL